MRCSSKEESSTALIAIALFVCSRGKEEPILFERLHATPLKEEEVDEETFEACAIVRRAAWTLILRNMLLICFCCSCATAAVIDSRRVRKVNASARTRGKIRSDRFNPKRTKRLNPKFYMKP